MRKISVSIFYSVVMLPVLLGGFSVSSPAADPLHIDVLYMNHGPLQPTLEQMRATFSRFGGKIQVGWHDFESRDGEAFKAEMGIKTHVPLQIWFDGKDTVTLGGKAVHFSGFPSGAGPGFFQGQWRLEDLETAIATLTRDK